jgi:ABC-type phosphate/phosphonate transport system substrate-binding protein
MYDLVELADVTDAFWGGMASRLVERGVPAPPRLTRDFDTPEQSWNDPQLLFSQTCGYPLMTMLRGDVSLLATPAYKAPGCEGPFHRSAVVVRLSDKATSLADLRGGRCAINQATSNTGMNLLRVEVSQVSRGKPYFDEVVRTGSHAASIAAVSEGRADVAAIDAVTLELLRRYRSRLTKAVRVLFWTVRAPGLPFITGRRRPNWTKLVWLQVLADLASDRSLRPVLDALLIEGFTPLGRTHYRSVLDLAGVAARNGYPELC